MYLQKFARTSTAKVQPPVCVGEVISYDFSVSLSERTDFIVKRLRENAALPGVNLFGGQNFVGMIPRQTIFERLGRRYGVELFLNKEVSTLYRELRAPAPLVIDGQMRVEDAVQKALYRDEAQLYHPVVVLHEGKHTLINMHQLITTQTEILKNLNSVATKLNYCAKIVEDGHQDIGVEKIIDALREVVPFHNAVFYTALEMRSVRVKGEAFIHLLNDAEKKANHFQVVEFFNQILCVDDLNGVFILEACTDETGKLPLAWMGVPLSVDGQYLGTLSLCRYEHTPFSNNEKELTSNYAWYLSRIMAGFLMEEPANKKSFTASTQTGFLNRGFSEVR